MTEIWKQCGVGVRRIYEASNLGNVRSINKCTNQVYILKQTASAYGYNFIKINRKNKFTHHLVMKAFHGDRPIDKVVDHIDRNKQNNCLENLRYCTHKENSMNTSRYRTDITETRPYERNLILVSQRMKKYYQRKKKVALINDL